MCVTGRCEYSRDRADASRSPCAATHVSLSSAPDAAYAGVRWRAIATRAPDAAAKPHVCGVAIEPRTPCLCDGDLRRGTCDGEPAQSERVENDGCEAVGQ